jgi:hypothetical protein
LDGDQVLDFYWIDPRDAAKRFISKPNFAGKLHTEYELQDSVRRSGKQAFGRAMFSGDFRCILFFAMDLALFRII